MRIYVQLYQRYFKDMFHQNLAKGCPGMPENFRQFPTTER